MVENGPSSARNVSLLEIMKELDRFLHQHSSRAAGGKPGPGPEGSPVA